MKKLTLFLVIFLILTSFGSVLTGVAFAAAPDKYTTVLEDLQKDETFDAAQFPAGDKAKMDVFQIAESNAGELFLYVYSPTGDKFTASDARISQSIGDNLEPEDYKLTLLSRSGTLSKYIVNGLQVKSDAVRYYLIYQLARPYDEDLDGKTSIGPGLGVDLPITGGGMAVSLTTLSGNEIKTVPSEVGKLFTATTSEEGTVYTEEHAAYIEVVNKYVGNIRYYDGETWGQDYYTSSHYVAFSTNILMDKVFEVVLNYDIRNYSGVSDFEFRNWDIAQSTYEYNNPVKPEKITLKSQEYASNNYKLLFFKHTWKEIQTVDDFVSTEKLDDSVMAELEDKQWVLRFATTDLTRFWNGALLGYSYNFSEVSNVTLLRLKFMAQGNIYNLGVVDNKQSGGSVTDPDNKDDPLNPGLNPGSGKTLIDKLLAALEWLKNNWWIFIIIGCLIVLAILAPFFPVIAAGFKVVGKGIAIFFKYLGKGLWCLIKYFGIGLFYVITSPYWIIRAIVKKCKGE